MTQEEGGGIARQLTGSRTRRAAPHNERPSAERATRRRTKSPEPKKRPSEPRDRRSGPGGPEAVTARAFFWDGGRGAHGFEVDVVDAAQVVDAVDRNRTVVRVMDRVIPHVAVSDGANHVEVDAITPNATHLTRVSHLDILDARRE